MFHEAKIAMTIPIMGGIMLSRPYEKPDKMFIAAPVFADSAVLKTGVLSIDVKKSVVIPMTTPATNPAIVTKNMPSPRSPIFKASVTKNIRIANIMHVAKVALLSAAPGFPLILTLTNTIPRRDATIPNALTNRGRIMYIASRYIAAPSNMVAIMPAM